MATIKIFFLALKNMVAIIAELKNPERNPDHIEMRMPRGSIVECINLFCRSWAKP